MAHGGHGGESHSKSGGGGGFFRSMVEGFVDPVSEAIGGNAQKIVNKEIKGLISTGKGGGGKGGGGHGHH